MVTKSKPTQNSQISSLACENQSKRQFWLRAGGLVAADGWAAPSSPQDSLGGVAPAAAKLGCFQADRAAVGRKGFCQSKLLLFLEIAKDFLGRVYHLFLVRRSPSVCINPVFQNMQEGNLWDLKGFFLFGFAVLSAKYAVCWINKHEKGSKLTSSLGRRSLLPSLRKTNKLGSH